MPSHMTADRVMPVDRCLLTAESRTTVTGLRSTTDRSRSCVVLIDLRAVSSPSVSQSAVNRVGHY